MPTQPKNECIPCNSGCASPVTERNRYFTGKFMAARDFQDEQDYLINHHRLHNRLLHGWGIICGLEVSYHPDPQCQKRWVIVHAGTAIDCCGRELFIPRDLAFELPLPVINQPPNQQVGQPGEQPAGQDEMNAPFLLGVCYQETLIDYVPALYAENACDTQRQQANRVREGIQLVYTPLDKVKEACWPRTERFSIPVDLADELDKSELSERLRQEFQQHGATLGLDALVSVEKAKSKWQIVDAGNKYYIRKENEVLNVYGQTVGVCREDCDDNGSGSTCLEPNCPCGDMVPLALVSFDPAHPDQGFHLNDIGRKYLAASGELLTHIVHVNWPHGGELSLKQLREDMNGELRVRFDRKLLPADGLRHGVNQMTFVVQYGGVQKGLEFLPFPRHGKHNLPRLDEDKCEAVYTIDHGFLQDADDEQDNIGGNWVYVSVKCDFLLDCHHRAVDGNFLGGRMPTGDGVPGGMFESWFRVVSESDRDEDRERRRERERDENRDSNEQERGRERERERR